MALKLAGEWAARHRVELGLTLRMSVAGLLAFGIGHLLGLTQVYWAVLTAVIVMQASIGGSLKAMLDRFVGTLGGAGWGVAVTISVPHAGALSTGIALTAALIPLSLLVAFRPTYRIAPVTAAIVLLGQTAAGGVVEAAVDRVFEIALGSIVALAVALSLAPARAHQALYAAAGDALATMADQITVLLAGVAAACDGQTVRRGHDTIRTAIECAVTICDEAARERRSYISDAPDPEPLVRTLRRLSHDLVIIARAVPAPLPEPVRDRLAASSAEISAALAAYLTGLGIALTNRNAPPPDRAVGAAFATFDAAVAGLRRDRLTVDLPDAEVERIFGLSFGLEQLRRNLDDLAARVAELAR